jgi:hypothetical protein
VQLRVEPQPLTLPETLAQPFCRRLFGDVALLVKPRIELGRGLERIAAVDEQCGALGKHDQQAG